MRNYECRDCSGCPLADQCGNKRQQGSNRTIQLNQKLEEYTLTNTTAAIDG
ncbi:transposase [Bacteroides sp.]|uniref:transposase n=1 Tax=Bacteroides sp. TaxID=29523 RepID=UPI003A9335A6